MTRVLTAVVIALTLAVPVIPSAQSAAGDREARDAVLANFPENDRAFAELAGVFRTALRDGEQGKLDVKATEAALDKFGPALRSSGGYFVGRFPGCEMADAPKRK